MRVRRAEVSRYGGNFYIFYLPIRLNSLAFQDFVEAILRLVVFEFVSYTSIQAFVESLK